MDYGNGLPTRNLIEGTFSNQGHCVNFIHHIQYTRSPVKSSRHAEITRKHKSRPDPMEDQLP